MSERPYNKTLGRLRLLGLYVVVGLLLYLARPSVWSVAAGAVLVALGEAVRFWSAGHLRKTVELVTSGPYRYTRNPLYLGRLLILTGLCIMVQLPYGGSWIALVLGWAAFFGYYLPRKERVEPARLSATHGEAFDRYFRAVPALFPSWKPYPDALDRRWEVGRMLKNREHWMVAGLLLATLFLLWRALSLQGG